MPGSELWTDGLICAFEYVGVRRKSTRPRSYSKIHSAYKMDGENMKKQVPTYGVTEAASSTVNGNNLRESDSLIELGDHLIAPSDDDTDRQLPHSDSLHTMERVGGCHWVPIGWARIYELVQTVKVDACWASQQLDIMDDEDDLTVADLAAPYWERPGGPRWWCHVTAGHPFVDAWLRSAQWLHPAVSIALRDESRLISDRMKHLLYEVPVRVAGGLLFELLGQSAGDPFVDEDDIPIVLRSWQAQNFLVTALHVKGSASSLNVLGITEVQEHLFAGGYNSPRSVHEVIALLASRLARWDDRLFRKSIFGEADEVELKFVNRRNYEDMNLFSIILNQEIRRLSRQVIRVKWSLHAKRGDYVMQSTVRAWLQDRSLRVTHNLAVFGGCGLVLSIITGLFGINVGGIPGSEAPYAFGVFTAVLFVLGIVLIVSGLLYLGLKRPITEEQVEIRKLELQELVKMFQHEAETHAQVRKNVSRNNLPPTNADKFLHEADYILIH
ncbi:magnesium transporter CorA-like family protein [Actinidia rufa]|uniref:Magnesium transporter CorA-like family protein n=1 Tax=Actinidia rufa TaxID=165716 RepID=A0A7J0DVP9_9ERIC|nr:magnesium transporter CorA-like family protein [Actinidia rufa]